MKRKLVKQGAATLMVSIPAKWAKQHNLDKGSEVEVEESHNVLRINSKDTSNKEITIILTEENKKDIKNLLTHAYRKGFEKIKFKDSNKETARQIHQIVDKMLLGFEITYRSESECIVENISEPSNKKYPDLLKRILFLIKEAHKSIFEDIKKSEYENEMEIQSMCDQSDKLILFCRRIIFKESEENMLLNWELLTFLMHIHHRYYYLYEYAKAKKFKAENEIINLYGQLEKYFNLLEDAITNNNIASIHKINSLKEEHHFGKIPQMLEKSSGKKTVVLAHINELFRLVQISSSPVLSIILNTQK